MFKPSLHILTAIAIFSVAHSCAFSQQSAAIDGLNYQIGFGQNLNSYRWQTSVQYVKSIFRGGLLSVNENFNSSLIRVNRLDDKWRDDQQLKIGLRYPMKNFWGLQLIAQSSQLNDRISGLVSDIKTNYAMAGIYARLFEKIDFNAAAGYKFDRRLSKTDRGLTYQIEFSTDTLDWGGYQNNIFGLVNQDRFAERKNSNVNLTYRVKKYFHSNTYDSLAVFFSQRRRDNYDEFAQVGLFLESLNENTKGVKHFLSYGVSDGLRLNIHTFFQLRNSQVNKKFKRNIVDQRSKEEFHSENKLVLAFGARKADVNFALGYTTNSQKSQIPDSVLTSKFSKYFYYISPDFQSSRLSLSLFSRLKFSRRDTLTLRAAINKFQYDTPETNMDDRDEFRMNFQAEFIHLFSDQLKVILNASANLYHLVYIFSERSANNNWMRIFRIFPKIVYQPNARFRLIQISEVLANYVDYDYETASSLIDVRSYVFRRFMIEHKLDWEFVRQLELSVDYKFEIEENGKFRWEQWTEIVMNDRRNHWVRASLNYRPRKYLIIAPGLIYFRRDVNSGDSFLVGSFGGAARQGFLSYGPTFSVRYYPSPKLVFSLEAMRRAVENSTEQRQFINFLNLRLNWIY